MRIAIVLPAVSLFSVARPNSMETVIRTLAPVAGPDETIRVFCDAGAEDHGDLDVHALPRGPGRMAAMVAALRAWDPDIIEFHQHISSASRIARRFPGKTRLLYRHNDVKTPRSLIRRWRYGRRHRPFDGFIFVSDASRVRFVVDYPSLAERAFTIRNPIDAGLWRSHVVEREKLIVFAGRAIPDKGLDLLCEALPGVLAGHSDWRATLFLGDWGKNFAWAEPHVERMLVRTRQVDVHRDGSLAEVRECLKRTAIAVVPSVWAEPLGLSALEAHAAGVALVSSGRGGLREASGPHALYVEPLTADALAAAIGTLIADRPRREALVQGGLNFVETEHSPAARAAELTALRRRLVSRTGSATGWRTSSSPNA